MKCPDAYEYWTLDEIAECADGLRSETRSELWHVLTEHGCSHDYREPGEACSKCGIPFPEWPEPDSPDRELLPEHWARLSEEAKTDIIAAAERAEKDW